MEVFKIEKWKINNVIPQTLREEVIEQQRERVRFNSGIWNIVFFS